MKQYLSKMYAEFLAFYFNSYVKYSHINPKGYWEFAIVDMDAFGNYLRIYYKTKGFKE